MTTIQHNHISSIAGCDQGVTSVGHQLTPWQLSYTTDSYHQQCDQALLAAVLAMSAGVSQ